MVKKQKRKGGKSSTVNATSTTSTTAAVIEALKKLCNESDSEDILEKFKVIADDISSLLPKVSDATVFELDDIFYPDDVTSATVSSESHSGESTKLIIDSCFQHYHKIYLDILYSEPRIFHVFDKAYLQFIENSSDEIFRAIYDDTIPETINTFIFSKKIACVVTALKVMKVACLKHRHIIEEDLLIKNPEIFLWLSKLQNLEQTKESQTKRIISWLSRQSTAIIQQFDVSCIQNNSSVKKYTEIYKTLKESVQEDNEDETAKIDRFILKLNSIVALFIRKLEDLLIVHRYLEERAIIADKNLRYDFKSYLSKSSNKEMIRKVSVPLNFTEKNKITDDSTDSEDEGEHPFEPDCTIEKHLYYDDYMRSLHVLSIIHTAFIKCETLLDINLPSDGLVFRNGNSIQRRFKRIFEGKIVGFWFLPWCISVAINKCPFLITPIAHYGLKNDLIRMANGELIDQVTREILYFILNNFAK